MNILITGGCGFQGSHVAERYAKKGDYVRIINTPSKHAMTNYKRYLKGYKNIDAVWGSVCDAELMEKCMEGIELVIHFAAKINVDESLLKPKDYIKTNLIGTQNVLTETYKHQVPLIHASTCEVYGENLWGDANVFENARKLGVEVLHVSSATVYGKLLKKDKYLMNEYHPLNPQSPYAASKAAGDRMAYAYIRSYGLTITIVRPFNIFGPRQKSGGFGAAIPIFFSNAMADDVIHVSGDGTQTRDYLYITDLVEGYKIIEEAHELRGKVVNIGSSHETEIGQLAREIVNIVGKGEVQYGTPRLGEVDSFICDNRLISQFGFEPKISVHEGLRLYYKELVAEHSE